MLISLHVCIKIFNMLNSNITSIRSYMNFKIVQHNKSFALIILKFLNINHKKQKRQKNRLSGCFVEQL